MQFVVRVLIETYWNVNGNEKETSLSDLDDVLIETYWNVNKKF